MGFVNQFPYSDFHEMNLDWIIAAVKNLQNQMGDFEAVNTVEFKGQWDITQQYAKWSIVTDGNNTYYAKQIIPAGVSITNTDYWVNTNILVVDNALNINSVNPISNS